MPLAEELRRANEPLWERMVTHPFVRELGDGTLPADKFRFYFLQDYVFVKALAKLLALGIAKAPDLQAGGRLSQFLQGILAPENDLFQRAFRELGVSPAVYQASRPAPTTLAFCNLLTRVGYEGTFPDILTILYVTEGTYLDWGTRLAEQGKRPQNRIYQEWIDIHSPSVLGEFVAWVQGQLDSSETGGRRPEIEDIFLTTLRYEYLFWEMAYKGETWPDQ